MEFLYLILIGALAAAVPVLLIKIYLLQKSADEIREAFAHRLTADTNALIGISSRDKHMRRMAASVNVQLQVLRAQRHRYLQGDGELKAAVTNISHDLRTPLTAVCGYLDLLEQKGISGDTARYLRIIRNRVELMNQLTEELFRYSVILTGDGNTLKQQTDIGGVLEESIAAFYGILSEHHITPRIQMPEKRILRMLDASALSRIFSNLLSNAVKYSDGDLDILLTEQGEITFSNTAHGLNQLQVGKLFDRFYTVEAARSSTGLGLAIARTLTEQMGGTITARYEDGRLNLQICLPDDQGQPE